MRNKFKLYTRFCKRCGNLFETEKKYSKFCDNCKEK